MKKLTFVFAMLCAVGANAQPSQDDISKLRQLVDAKADAVGVNCFRNVDCMHALTQSIAEQAACLNPRWGRKSASESRPISIDTIAWRVSEREIWVVDFMNSAGDPEASKQWYPVGIVEQFFRAVPCPSQPPPDPHHPPPVEPNIQQLQLNALLEIIKELKAQNEAIVKSIGELRAEVARGIKVRF